MMIVAAIVCEIQFSTLLTLINLIIDAARTLTLTHTWTTMPKLSFALKRHTKNMDDTIHCRTISSFIHLGPVVQN